MQSLNTQIEEIEDFVLSHCKGTEHYSLITGTPGIGKMPGMTIILGTGSIERFAQVATYSLPRR